MTRLLFNILAVWLGSVCMVFAGAGATKAPYSLSAGFLKNVGQLRNELGKPATDVQYYLHGAKVRCFVQRDRLSFVVKKKAYNTFVEQSPRETVTRVDVVFEGGYASSMREISHANGMINLFDGTADYISLKRANELLLENVYKGVDLRLLVDAEGLVRYNVESINPAALKQVQIRIDGADSVQLDASGALRMFTPITALEQTAPHSYQVSNGEQKVVKSSFVQVAATSFRYAVESTDSNAPVVVDPLTKVWGTYYGGIDTDEINEVHTFASWIAVAGFSASETAISSAGSHQFIKASYEDAFYARFAQDGRLVWATYYGGENRDFGVGCKIDYGGSEATSFVYFYGCTKSVSGIATPGSFKSAIGAFDQNDMFLVKARLSDGLREWATYVGGNQDEYRVTKTGIIVDIARNVVVCGQTKSIDTTYISAHQRENNTILNYVYKTQYSGQQDIFVIKFNPQGARIWGTYFGGSDEETGAELAYANPRFVVTGTTKSSDGIVTDLTKGHQKNLIGTRNDFVFELSFDGKLIWSTYYGESQIETGTPAAFVDDAYNTYVVATTKSDSRISWSSGYSSRYSGNGDGYLVKFSPVGDRLWGTYIGGIGIEKMYGITIKPGGNIYVSGITTSDTGIATNDASQPVRSGVYDGFVCEFTTNGEKVYGTYVGGADYESSCYIFNTGFTVYLTGKTESEDRISKPYAHQPVYNGPDSYGDGYLMRFDVCSPSPNIQGDYNRRACKGTLDSIGIYSSEPNVVYRWLAPPEVVGRTEHKLFFQAEKSALYQLEATYPGGCTNIATFNYQVFSAPPVPFQKVAELQPLSACEKFKDTTIIIRNTLGYDVYVDTSFQHINGIFSIVQPTGNFNIKSGDTLEVTLRFTPSGTGVQFDTLTLSGLECRYPVRIPLSGSKIGYSPRAEFIRLGSTKLCETNVLDTFFFVPNTSTKPITLDMSNAIVPNNVQIIAPVTNQIIAPNDSVRVSIRCTITQSGAINIKGILKINTADCPPFDSPFTISGSADVPLLSTTATVLQNDIGACETYIEKEIELTNQSNIVATITGNTHPNISFTQLPLQLQPLATTKITVRIKPTALGSYLFVDSLLYTPCTKALVLTYAGTKRGILYTAPDTVDLGTLYNCGPSELQSTFTVENKTEDPAKLTPFYTFGDVVAPFDLKADAVIGVDFTTGAVHKFGIHFKPNTTSTWRDSTLYGKFPIGFRECLLKDTIVFKAQFKRVELQANVNKTPTVTVGDRDTITVSYQNTGVADITIQTMPVLAAPFTVYASQPALPVTLKPNERVEFFVDYAPQTENVDNASLMCNISAPCTTPFNATLQGTGSNKKTDRLTALQLDFGSVLESATVRDSFMITNTGKATAEEVQVVLENNADALFTIVSAPTTLAENQSAYCVVECNANNASVVQVYNATARITSKTSDITTPIIASIVPERLLLVTAPTFGLIEVGNNTVKDIDVRHAKRFADTISTAFVKTQGSDFTLAAQSYPLIVAPSLPLPLSVTFTPSREGVIEDSLIVVTPTRRYAVLLAGEGYKQQPNVPLRFDKKVYKVAPAELFSCSLVSSTGGGLIPNREYRATIKFHASLAALPDVSRCSGLPDTCAFTFTGKVLSASEVGTIPTSFRALLSQYSESVLRIDSLIWLDNGSSSQVAPSLLRVEDSCIDRSRVVFTQGGVNLLSMYPNPAHSTVVLGYQCLAGEQIQIEMYNTQGERIATIATSSNCTSSTGLEQTTVDVSNVANGVYSVRYTSSTKVFSLPFVVFK